MIYPDLPNRALSIRQPWAWAIINAGKDIENRTWRTKVRGAFCIHASKASIRAEWPSFRASVDDVKASLMWPENLDIPSKFDQGGIVATAIITDCVDQPPPRSYWSNPWFFGPYGFALTNVKPVNFIPVKGALGFFDWRKNIKQMPEVK